MNTKRHYRSTPTVPNKQLCVKARKNPHVDLNRCAARQRNAQEPLHHQQVVSGADPQHLESSTFQIIYNYLCISFLKNPEPLHRHDGIRAKLFDFLKNGRSLNSVKICNIFSETKNQQGWLYSCAATVQCLFLAKNGYIGLKGTQCHRSLFWPLFF